MGEKKKNSSGQVLNGTEGRKRRKTQRRERGAHPGEKKKGGNQDVNFQGLRKAVLTRKDRWMEGEWE